MYGDFSQLAGAVEFRRASAERGFGGGLKGGGNLWILAGLANFSECDAGRMGSGASFFGCTGRNIAWNFRHVI